MIAVSVGEGLDEAFKELGVDYVITGGQTMNPSIDSIAQAIRKVNARNVFVFPNNSNIILAAQQAAELVSCNVVVLPTKTIPQGLSSVMMFNPMDSVEVNTEAMTDAISNVVSGAVTYAVRKTHFNGKDIEEGDILGMMNNDLCVVGESVHDASLELLSKMMEKKGEPEAAVTIFYGADVSEADAEAFLAAAEEAYPEAECMLQSGGQSLYYYYLAVE